MRNIFSLCLLPLVLLSACSSTKASDDTLVVGLECNYAPFNWTESGATSYTLPISNHAGSYADGYDIQMSKLLSEKTGKKVKIVQTVWESLIPDLQSGSLNCIIAGMTDTAEREQSIDFTDEYYRSELVLVVKKEVADAHPGVLSKDDFTSLIKGKQIESQNETLTDDIIQNVFVPLGAIHNTAVGSFALASVDVEKGLAFAMTAEYPVAQSIVASNSDTLGILHLDQTILGEELKSLGVSIGLQKGSVLKTSLNAALSSISQEMRVSLMSEALSRSSGK